MVKRWPSCWMTMPGRSCVALTLLISSLERLRISEIQAGQEHGRIRNDSRHVGRKCASNAKQQYKWARFPRSIILNSRYRIFQSPPNASMLALVGHEFVQNVDCMSKGVFALIFGPPCPAAFGSDYFSIERILNRMFFLQSILISLPQAFTLWARELLLTETLRPGRNLASHFVTSSSSEALALSGHRHSGIMNVNQAPAAPYFLIELRFAAVGGEGGAVFSELGGKIPIEFGLGGVAENMDGNVVNA